LYDEATNPETLPKRLKELAQDEHLAPLVAANPNAPEETLLTLAQAHPRAFLANPILPLLYLEDPGQFMKMNKFTALAVLRLDEIHPWLLTAWRQHPDQLVREAVSYHIGQFDGTEWMNGLANARAALQRTPIIVSQRPTSIHFPPLELPNWIAVTLRQHQNSAVSAAIVRAEIPQRLLAQFAKQKDARQAVASHPNTPESLLGLLARGIDYPVLMEVAYNLNTSPHILRYLSQDSSSMLRAQVARNPHTPSNILHNLARDTDPSVRASLASNPATPINILRRLLTDKDVRVCRRAQWTLDSQSQIATGHQRSISTAKQCRQIARSLAVTSDTPNYEFQRIILLSYPDLPSNVLGKYATSWRWPERYVIARHPNTSRSTLEELTRDGNRFVRAVAREQLSR
jgi:hypothetical protein